MWSAALLLYKTYPPLLVYSSGLQRAIQAFVYDKQGLVGHKHISIMPQEQSVIISPQSAFIFKCPWFIQRQCVPPTPHPPIPPSLPLSMISAALCRSVQIESGMDELVATWVGVRPSVPLVRQVPQQAEEETETGR